MKKFFPVIPVLLLLFCSSAHAQTTWTVTSTADSGTGSLRAALASANAGSGDQLIQFQFSSPTTITIASPLAVTSSQHKIAISGSAGSDTQPITISGNGSTTVFQVSAGGMCYIENLTISSGFDSSSSSAGGIYNQGYLNLSGVTFTNNTGVLGAAINSPAGTLVATNCTISGNTSTNNSYGSIIYVQGNGAGSFTYCTISANFGGAYAFYYSSSGQNSGTLYNNIIAGNQADLPFISYASGSDNILGGTSQPSGLTNTINTSNPQLTLLGNHGGLTQTMRPNPQSPAVDAGISVNGVTTDQRGVTRPQGNGPDIGAVELGATNGVVTNTNDTGPGSLRATIAGFDVGTVTFNIPTSDPRYDSTTGVYTIALSMIGDNTFGPSALLIDKSVIIDGGTSKITIGRDTTAQPTRLRQFYVTFAGNLTLRNVTVANGRARGGLSQYGGGGAGLGGAIVNAGTLQIDKTTFSGNQATGGDTSYGGAKGGGGMASDGSGINGGGPNGGTGCGGLCQAGAGGFGGGGGAADYRDGAGGFGGGGGGGSSSYGSGGFGGGGGGRNASGGWGGGNSGDANWHTGGSGAGLGGAIFNYGGTIQVTNSTFATNSASGGYAPYAGGLLVNGAGLGGAIFNLNGTVTATFATFAGNAGGGIYSLGATGIATQSGPTLPAAAATVTLKNSILSGSGTNDFFQNTLNSGIVASSGTNNIIQTTSSGVNNFGGTAVNSDPQLNSLANNGGPTQTIKFAAPASPAYNTGVAVSGITTDQRGVSRTAYGAPDIGALELDVSAPIITSPSSTTFRIGVGGSFTFAASGNLTTTFSYTGTLPSGITLSSQGVLSGTTSAGGVYPFTVTASNGMSPDGTQNFTLNVYETPSTIVNDTSDVASYTDNKVTLRDALAYAQAAGGTQTITFSAALAGQTIILSNGWSAPNDPNALAVNSGNITIQGATTAPGVTIAIASGVQKRHIYVASGASLTVKNLTFTNGRGPDFGGSVWSQGSLTVTGCTFTGNIAGQEGGAIQSWGDSALLAIDNSTFSGNSSNGVAGAIDSGATSMTFRHLTITNNAATSGYAMVLYKNSATMANSIIAGNTNDGVGSSNGGAFNAGASTNNIFGSGGSAGLTNGSNGNQVGVNPANVQLGPLADNGGPTRTVAIGLGSIARDTAAPSGLTTDQRGTPRPQNGVPDVGAYELAAFSVVNSADSGIGSLRQAIASANAIPTSAVIVLDSSLAGQTINTSVFDTGLDPDGAGSHAFRISSDVTVIGPSGANGLTIQRPNNASSNYRLFYVYNATNPAGARLTLQDVTLSGGVAKGGDGSGGAAGLGGAIFNRGGTVSLLRCTLTGNIAQGGNGSGGAASLGGGGMGADAPAGSNGGGPNGGVQSNGFGGDGGFGGGGSTGANQYPGGRGGFGGGGGYGRVSVPSGGGLTYCAGGFGGGGGLPSYDSPQLYSASYFGGGYGSKQQGAIVGGGGAGMGGAIFNESGTVNLVNCTLAANATKGGTGWVSGSAMGGAIFTRNGTVTVTFSTLAQNAGDGGAIYAVADGGSGADFSAGNVQVTINNSILGGSDGTNVDFNSAAINSGNRTFSGSNNIVQMNAGNGNGFSGTNTQNVDPKLGSLGNYGGLTPTVPLLPGSPAINAAVVITGITADQRGVSRSQYGSAPDIGAYEYDNQSLIVTTATDELDADSDPSHGTGTSLREAIRYANSLGGTHTITFSPALAGNTIILTTAAGATDSYVSTSALSVSGSLIIQGPTTGPGVTLNVASGLQLRHFFVNSGATLTLSNLTLIGGNAPVSGFGYGGAVWSFGSLAVRGCTFTGNTAGQEGGAIQAWGDSPAIVIDNSTFSGNSSNGIGGAIDAGSVSMIFRYVTVTNNSATNGNALVLYKNTATMIDSIIAGNVNEGVGSLNGGSFDTNLSTNNILGSGGTAGLTNGVNGNITGATAAQLNLDSLADNGGPTKTVALESGSIALDAGVVISGLTTDQRGISRPQGAAVDIGALEAVFAAIPIIRPLGGTYENSLQISITSTSSGTTVRYTLDGSTPSKTSGSVYTRPFTLTQDTTVKAIAYGTGWSDSPIASVGYSILPPLPYWRQLQGLAANGSQDLGNPSGDGITNLLKYGFNLAPNAGDLAKPNYLTLPSGGNAGLPRITRDAQGHLVIEFVRRIASTNPGITYTVETGQALNSWNTLDLTNATVTSIDNSWERVTVTDPAVTPRRFGRVRIQEP